MSHKECTGRQAPAQAGTTCAGAHGRRVRVGLQRAPRRTWASTSYVGAVDIRRPSCASPPLISISVMANICDAVDIRQLSPDIGIKAAHCQLAAALSKTAVDSAHGAAWRT